MATRHKFPAFAVGTFLSIYPFFFTAAEPGETPIAPELENRVEPTYKGRTLASWLGDLGNKPAGPEYQPAADAIRQMGAATIPYLLRALEQADAFPEKADHAVNAFRELGVQAKDATPKLSELLSKESSSSFAANALVALGADAPVIELMAQSNRQLRKNAIVALGSYGANAEAVPELVPLLRDKDDELRALTAWALGAISKEDEKCVPALARSLDDQTAWVRANAATALSNFKSERNISLPALIHSTADKDESVRDSAISSLRRLFHVCAATERREIVAALIKSLDDPSKTVQISAVWALATSLPESQTAAPRLLELAKAGGGDLSSAATAALGHIEATKKGGPK